jgi:hypothetical protein
LISYFVDNLNQEYNLKKAFWPTAIKSLERPPTAQRPTVNRELKNGAVVPFSRIEVPLSSRLTPAQKQIN